MDRRTFMQLAGGTVALHPIDELTRSVLRHASIGASPDIIDAPAFHAMRRFAQTPFGKIAYVERGRGPAALFLHGFTLNGFQWRGAIERLASHRRCIAPDFMGMGYSEVPADQSLAPDAQVAMLQSLLEKLSVSSVDLVANDSGGAIAQLFLAKYPERVHTLLLTNCDTAIDSPPPSFAPIVALSRAGQFASKSLVAQRRNKELARSAKRMGGLAYTYPTNPSDEAIDTYLSPLVSSPLRMTQVEQYAIALDRNWLENIEPALRRSTVATRIVWGTSDTIFSAKSPEWLDKAFGSSRARRRREAVFPEEMPDVIADEARRLWAPA